MTEQAWQPVFWVRPHFHVADVAASVGYYCDCLGFTKAWSHGEGRPIVAQVGRADLDIILDSGSVLPKAAVPSVVGMALHQPDKLGTLYQELKDRGAKITAPPFPVVWQAGLYQFDVQDLDGNTLMFCGNKPKE